MKDQVRVSRDNLTLSWTSCKHCRTEVEPQLGRTLTAVSIRSLGERSACGRQAFGGTPSMLGMTPVHFYGSSPEITTSSAQRRGNKPVARSQMPPFS